jgi:hypothetical protein
VASTLAAKTINVVGAALLLLGGTAVAQQPLTTYQQPQPVQMRSDAQVIPTTSQTMPAAGMQQTLVRPMTGSYSQGSPYAPAQGAPGGVTPVYYQPAAGAGKADPTLLGPDESLSVVPPGFEAIFNHLYSEAQLQESIRQFKNDKEMTRADKDQPRDSEVRFPDEPLPVGGVYKGRNWPRRATFAEPNFVVYDRLFFEDINSERYGWDLGIAAPFVSTAIFAKDLLLFPMHAGTDPFRIHESNAGYALPGDNMPYMIYPPEVSLTGAIAEAAAVVTILAVFP